MRQGNQLDTENFSESHEDENDNDDEKDNDISL